MKKLLIDNKLCSGCRICESICSYNKLREKFNRKKAAIKVVVQGELGEINKPVVCRHCKNAKCFEVCPADAFYTHDVTGALLIDSTKCIGCGLCAQECPFGAIFLHEELEVPIKCDLCNGDPLCVKYCVPGAIKYEDENRVGANNRERRG
ncbi:hypothetical protein JCM17380_33780 [Desulfosporosinus burensis]